MMLDEADVSGIMKMENMGRKTVMVTTVKNDDDNTYEGLTSTRVLHHHAPRVQAAVTAGFVADQ